MQKRKGGTDCPQSVGIRQVNVLGTTRFTLYFARRAFYGAGDFYNSFYAGWAAVLGAKFPAAGP